MKFLAGIILGGSSLFLTACATVHTVVTGPVEPAIETAEVQILYQRPTCDFVVVARIDIPGNYFNRVHLIDAMREQAAALGADRLQIIDLQKVGASEYRGTARALRCQ